MRLWSSGTSCPVAVEKPARRRREKNSSGGESCESCALRSAARWNQVRLLCLRERQVVEVGKLSGALLDFHISRLGGFVFSPFPLRKEKKKKGSRKPSVLCPLALSPPQRPARVAGRPPDRWMDRLSVSVGRSAAVEAVSRTWSPGTVNLVEGLCSQVSYIAWDSTGVGGLPTRQHRRKTEGGG